MDKSESDPRHHRPAVDEDELEVALSLVRDEEHEVPSSE
jgi:hypothetical protein